MSDDEASDSDVDSAPESPIKIKEEDNSGEGTNDDDTKIKATVTIRRKVPNVENKKKE